MPRLHGYYQYQFVEPGFVHPKGYAVEVVTDAGRMAPEGTWEEFLDRMAQRQEQYAQLLELESEICAKYGHRAPHDGRDPKETTPVTSYGCKHFETDCGLWICQRRARDARSYTRTAERTVLARSPHLGAALWNELARVHRRSPWALPVRAAALRAGARLCRIT